MNKSEFILRLHEQGFSAYFIQMRAEILYPAHFCSCNCHYCMRKRS